MSQFVFEFIVNGLFALAGGLGIVKDDGKPWSFSAVVVIVFILVVVVYLLIP